MYMSQMTMCNNYLNISLVNKIIKISIPSIEVREIYSKILM